MGKTDASSSGSHILRILRAPRGHALNGISDDKLVTALHELPVNTNRALNTLIEEGLTLKLENGCFTPDVQLLQVAMAHSNEMARTQDRIDETNQRAISGSCL